VVGVVKEVIAEPGSSSFFMTVISDSQEWSLSIPEGAVIPDVGRMIAMSCHATDSGLVLDDLNLL
jgi:hypothetical protein